VPAAPTPTSRRLSGGERRRVALCSCSSSSPTCWLSTSHQHTWSRSVSGLSSTWRVPGHRHRGHHDRYFMEKTAPVDPRARPRPRLPPTRATTPPTWRRRRAASSRGGQGRQDAQALDDELEWVRSSARARRTKSRRGSSVREWPPRRQNRKLDFEEIPIPRAALGTPCRGRAPVKGFDDRVSTTTSASLPRNGIVGSRPERPSARPRVQKIVGERTGLPASSASADT